MKKKWILLLFIVIILATAWISLSTVNSASDDDSDIDNRVQEIFDSMDTGEKNGQLFMVSWTGLDPAPILITLIEDYHVSSIYISGRKFFNTEGPNPTAAEQVADLTNTFQETVWNANKKPNIGNSEDFLPMFLAVDQSSHIL